MVSSWCDPTVPPVTRRPHARARSARARMDLASYPVFRRELLQHVRGLREANDPAQTRGGLGRRPAVILEHADERVQESSDHGHDVGVTHLADEASREEALHPW